MIAAVSLNNSKKTNKQTKNPMANVSVNVHKREYLNCCWWESN